MKYNECTKIKCPVICVEKHRAIDGADLLILFHLSDESQHGGDAIESESVKLILLKVDPKVLGFLHRQLIHLQKMGESLGENDGKKWLRLLEPPLDVGE